MNSQQGPRASAIPSLEPQLWFVTTESHRIATESSFNVEFNAQIQLWRSEFLVRNRLGPCLPVFSGWLLLVPQSFLSAHQSRVITCSSNSLVNQGSMTSRLRLCFLWRLRLTNLGQVNSDPESNS